MKKLEPKLEKVMITLIKTINFQKGNAFNMCLFCNFYEAAEPDSFIVLFYMYMRWLSHDNLFLIKCGMLKINF